MRDDIVSKLRESGFLTDLKGTYTHYDIEDYRADNNCPELTDEFVLERLVLEDLLTDDMQLDRKKIAKHIYEHRKTLSRETIAIFFIYAEVTPEIERLLGVLKDFDTKHDVKEDKQGNDSALVQNYTFNGNVVINNGTNIEKNYGPNIEHNGGALTLPDVIKRNVGE